ncbi:MAG: hypothetical protein ACXAE3_02535 [Candidatus Kariarchaeaceae archaeon]|jgi:hypothetical protein
MVVSVEVEFHAGPFSLAGQIDYPNEADTFPALLIVPGAPQHDRFGNVRGYSAYNNYLEALKDTLIDAGYAVFRWDKGGTGKSSSGLSAPMNMVSAYRKLTGMDRVDRTRIGILAIAGGSAHVYRKWGELQEINATQQLILLSTGVNDLKLEDLEVPIGLLMGNGEILRSQRALDRYSEQKKLPVMYYSELNASEQLFDITKGKVNLFNALDAKWHPSILEKLKGWIIERSNLQQA